MKRRSLLVASSCALLSISGCISSPGQNGGLLSVLKAETPDETTVTPSDDERIRTVEPLQTALDTARDDGLDAMRLDSSEFDTTATALTPLPWYEPEKDSSSPSGIYIRHEDATYAVYLQPYCADSIFVNAESERDVYGRGGCVPPEVRPENS